jgi:hypothetical protein
MKERIIFMSRPKKEKEITHTRDVHFRLTDAQYSVLTDTAEAAGMNVSDYIRTMLLKGKVIVKYEITADVPEIKKLIAEFGKIGSNLNQIARYFNQGGIHSQEMRSEIKKCIGAIYEMKYEVMKMAGDFCGDTETYSK